MMMLQQLTVKEIDQIISFLQESFPYELIKRLEQLKTETKFNITMENFRLIQRMEEERQINENGFGTSPVSTAYFKIEELKEDRLMNPHDCRIGELEVFEDNEGYFFIKEKCWMPH